MLNERNILAPKIINKYIMRRIIFLTLGFFLLLASGCTSTKPDSVFSLQIKIQNPRVGKIILTQEEDISLKKSKFIDEIKPDSEGYFEQGFDLEPHIYTLDFYGEKKVSLAIDRGQNVLVEVDEEDLDNIKVSGSEDTVKLRSYEKFRKESLDRLVISVREKLKASGDTNNTDAEADGLAEIVNYEKHKTELNAFVKENLADSIALYATSLRWEGDDNLPLFENLVSSFKKKHGDLQITKRLKEKIELLKATSVGGKAPPIEMPDKDGNPTKLEPSKAKYTLIDFWASWCGPCRRESKKIANLFKKYDASDFSIYSVSLDDDREKWLEATEKDGRTWESVSSLKGMETAAAFDYAVTAIPAKFLIDTEGKIVAKNLHGTELEEKLKELLSR